MSAAVAHRSQIADRHESGAGRRQPAGATARQRADETARRPEVKARPRLEVLDRAATRRRARRRNALLGAFVVVLAGLFAVALVHAQLVESQQDLDELRSRIDELEDQRAQIERAIDEASAPARIVERAEELGMVRAEDPAFLVAVSEASSRAEASPGASAGPQQVSVRETGDG